MEFDAGCLGFSQARAGGRDARCVFPRSLTEAGCDASGAHLIVEGPFADIQLLGDLAAGGSWDIDGCLQHSLLHFLKRLIVAHSTVGDGLPDGAGGLGQEIRFFRRSLRPYLAHPVIQSQGSPFGFEKEHSLHRILQFTDVPQERLRFEISEQIRLYGSDRPIETAMTMGKGQDQAGEVAAAVAQRRELQSYDIQPVVEVRTEAAFAHQGLQGPVGGCNDADIDGNLDVRSNGTDGAALQNIEQLWLQRQRKIVDVIEKEGPASPRLKESLSIGHSAGEGAALVSKQFTLRQSLTDGAAMNGNESKGRALAIQAMNRVGKNLFAGSGLAFQQYGYVTDVGRFSGAP